MSLPVSELEERLAKERNLTKLWHTFMDMTQLKEFQVIQRRCRDEALVESIGAAITRQAVIQLSIRGAVTVTLFELPPYDIVHGPLTLPTGLGNVFYFRGSDVGLIAIPNGASTHPIHQWTMVRFSVGKPLALAAGSH